MKPEVPMKTLIFSTFSSSWYSIKERFVNIFWLIDISSMVGLPTFDSSSDGHEPGVAVPSEGSRNLASYERSRDPGLPGEWGYTEPRWEDIFWDVGWGMVQIIKCVSEKGRLICIRGRVLGTYPNWRLDAWWHFSFPRVPGWCPTGQ